MVLQLVAEHFGKQTAELLEASKVVDDVWWRFTRKTKYTF